MMAPKPLDLQQGGLLSTLLSNIVLNDLDHWVAGQWELFPLTQPFKSRAGERYAKIRSSLKEGYLVRKPFEGIPSPLISAFSILEMHAKTFLS
ncbi:hypothetical protein [Paenibacillus agricola]|uniref:hypothetical protein n=1 Tax=Paenibacillus agricola TaxID=2716264 RepID=UPI00289370A3|nr:hypothetical protein [Paenibacillus agricola]